MEGDREARGLSLGPESSAGSIPGRQPRGDAVPPLLRDEADAPAPLHRGAALRAGNGSTLRAGGPHGRRHRVARCLRARADARGPSHPLAAAPDARRGAAGRRRGAPRGPRRRRKAPGHPPPDALLARIRLRGLAELVVDPLDSQGRLGAIKQRFIAQGYAWVDVDTRGSGASFGSRPWDFSPDEIQDGAEVVDWIVAQPWSNGRVGAAGASYSGTAAEFLLVNRHPAVKAVATLLRRVRPVRAHPRAGRRAAHVLLRRLGPRHGLARSGRAAVPGLGEPRLRRRRGSRGRGPRRRAARRRHRAARRQLRFPRALEHHVPRRSPLLGIRCGDSGAAACTDQQLRLARASLRSPLPRARRRSCQHARVHRGPARNGYASLCIQRMARLCGSRHLPLPRIRGAGQQADARPVGSCAPQREPGWPGRARRPSTTPASC